MCRLCLCGLAGKKKEMQGAPKAQSKVGSSLRIPVVFCYVGDLVRLATETTGELAFERMNKPE